MQHSPVTRRNLEWPPIMASRHVVFGKDPARASRSVVVFSCLRVYVIFEASISFHVLHCFLARRCIFCAFCCVSWRACGDSCVLACQGLFGGVGCGGGVGWGGGGGGWGGVGGGLITFLFINVPASSFLTRFSLLQVTVWHAVDVSVLICWRWCPVACGHGVGFGGIRTFTLTSVLATTSLHAFLLCNSYHHHLQHHHRYQHNNHH